jgi:hypothetical protein
VTVAGASPGDWTPQSWPPAGLNRDPNFDAQALVSGPGADSELWNGCVLGLPPIAAQLPVRTPWTSLQPRPAALQGRRQQPGVGAPQATALRPGTQLRSERPAHGFDRARRSARPEAYPERGYPAPVALRFAYNTNGLAHHRPADALRLLADLGYAGAAVTPDVGALDPLGDWHAQRPDACAPWRSAWASR